MLLILTAATLKFNRKQRSHAAQFMLWVGTRSSADGRSCTNRTIHDSVGNGMMVSDNNPAFPKYVPIPK